MEFSNGDLAANLSWTYYLTDLMQIYPQYLQLQPKKTLFLVMYSYKNTLSGSNVAIYNEATTIPTAPLPLVDKTILDNSIQAMIELSRQ